MVQYQKEERLSVHFAFKLKPEELELLFERDRNNMPDNEGERRETLSILEDVGYADGLIYSLASDLRTGIVGDVKDLKTRQDFFGVNSQPLPRAEPFWRLLVE